MRATARTPSGRPVRPALPIALAAATTLALVLAISGTPSAGTRQPEGRRESRRAAALRAADYDAATRRWREGPVRYLLTKDEDDAFRALTTDDERALFIQRFWLRRDLDPATPDNEYRALFYRRVAEATHLFTESTTPGWKTDRGKIYILLGPPDEVDQRSLSDIDDGVQRGLGPDLIVWTYRNPPPGIDVTASMSIRFVKDHAGEYYLNDRVALPGLGTTIPVGLQAPAMQMRSLPDLGEILDTIVSAANASGSAPVRVHRDFFMASDGSTLTLLTVSVNPDRLEGHQRGAVGVDRPRATAGAEPAPAAPSASEEIPPGQESQPIDMLARLVFEGGEGAIQDLIGPGGFEAIPAQVAGAPEGTLVFQGERILKPGRYTAYYGVVDRATGRIDSYKEALTIPEFTSDALSLSSVMLASRIAHRKEAGAHGDPSPAVPGDFTVVPHPDDAFRSGESLAFYCQVNGSTSDPIDGHPDLDLEYRFFIEQRTGAGRETAFAPLGQPIHITRQQSPIQWYSLPLKDWRPAAYKLLVQVTDNLTGRHSSREVPFRVF